MNEMILGLDTSNYRTSAAVITRDGRIVLNERRLLKVPGGERGLRQSDAVFLHIQQLKEMAAAIRQATTKGELIAVAVSTRPRDQEDSYMPVFQVGNTIGQYISAVLHVPCYETSHQMGHLFAAAYGTILENRDHYLAIHLSGGTTELLVRNGMKITLLGGTKDLHAGQLVDRTGVSLGLGFPAGPEMEALAEKGTARGRLGCSMEGDDLFCHFSGAETRVQQWIREGSLPKEDIAREVFELLARTVARLLHAGRKKTGIKQALVTGGVAASGLLRHLILTRLQMIDQEIETVFGSEELSGDNAVGTALAGACMLQDDMAENKEE